MSRQAADPNAKGSAAWSAEGPEAAAVLDLARSEQALSAPVEQASERRFLAAFREHTDARAERKQRVRVLGRWRYGFALVAACALGLLVFRAGTTFRQDALSYRVKSGEETGAHAITAAADPVELDFSDGTVVMVQPDTKAQVAEVTQRGARFRLDSGRMAFNVVPHADRGNWSVDAGPFQVRVTGTIFAVEWLAAEGALEVDVTRGHVVVDGLGQHRELGPGDSFHHREHGAPAPSSASASERAANAITDAIIDDEQAPARAPALLPPSTTATPRVTTWSQLVSSGDFASVIDSANQRGLGSCLDACSQDDLRALADAARLSGKAALAERAYLAQRSRFAGSADATSAAFLLGRQAEDRHDARATGWYDTYLAEAPKGRFAADAWGRKMMLVASSDRKRAAALAEEYLQRFPKGAYRSHAESLLDAAQHRR